MTTTLTGHTCSYDWCAEPVSSAEHLADPATITVSDGQIECRAWVEDDNRRDDEITLYVEQVDGSCAEVHLTPGQARQLQATLGTAIENAEGAR